MPAMKVVKTVSDGKQFWLIWHWEMLVQRTTKLDAAAYFVSGPFLGLEDAEREASDAVAKGWTPEPYQSATHS